MNNNDNESSSLHFLNNNELNSMERHKSIVRKPKKHLLCSKSRQSMNKVELLAKLVDLYNKQEQINRSKLMEQSFVRQQAEQAVNMTLLERTTTNVYYYYYLHSPSSFLLSQKCSSQSQSGAKSNCSSQNVFSNSSSYFDSMTSSMISMVKAEELNKAKPAATKKSKSKSGQKSNAAAKPAAPVPNENKAIDERRENVRDMKELLKLNCHFLDNGQEPKRILLSSTVLKNMPLSEKFVDDAKQMVFVPKSKSFYPRVADNHLKHVI